MHEVRVDADREQSSRQIGHGQTPSLSHDQEDEKQDRREKHACGRRASANVGATIQGQAHIRRDERCEEDDGVRNSWWDVRAKEAKEEFVGGL